MDETYPVYIISKDKTYPNLRKKNEKQESRHWGVLLFLQRWDGWDEFDDSEVGFDTVYVYLSRWDLAKEAQRTGKIGTRKIEHTHTSLQKVSDRGEAEAIAATYLISGRTAPVNKSLPLKTHYMALGPAKKHYGVTKWDLNRMAKEREDSYVFYLAYDKEKREYIERHYYRKSICDEYFGGQK